MEEAAGHSPSRRGDGALRVQGAPIGFILSKECQVLYGILLMTMKAAVFV